MGLGLMVFNATFNNIAVISWRSVLLVEKITDQSQVTDKLLHNVVSSTPHHDRDSNSQLYCWHALIAQAVVNLTTIRSRPRRPLIAVDHGFGPRLGKTKNYKILYNCYFSTKHSTFRTKSKDCLDRNRDNVSKWSDICLPWDCCFIGLAL